MISLILFKLMDANRKARIVIPIIVIPRIVIPIKGKREIHFVKLFLLGFSCLNIIILLLLLHLRHYICFQNVLE